MIIKKEIKERIKSDNKIIGEFMGTFNKGERTIRTWFEEDNILLETDTAKKIISKNLNLPLKDIFEQTTILA